MCYFLMSIIAFPVVTSLKKTADGVKFRQDGKVWEVPPSLEFLDCWLPTPSYPKACWGRVMNGFIKIESEQNAESDLPVAENL